MKRICSALLALLLCTAVTGTAAAAGPERAAARLDPNDFPAIQWRASAIGRSYFDWDDESHSIRNYQTFLYVNIHTGEYYYTQVDLGPM